MLVHLLVYLPGREGLSDDQLGLQMTRNYYGDPVIDYGVIEIPAPHS